MKKLLAVALLPILSIGARDAQPIAVDHWTQIWSDEFNDPVIDHRKWTFDLDCWGGGNNERQCYTGNSRNAEIADGKLVITARRERSRGPALPASQGSSRREARSQLTREFTSARLSTRGRASWRYGRVEVRARLPQGQGSWPAIWMLPDHDSYGPWAASGEIDILEAVNLGVPCAGCVSGREDTILGTLHFGGAWPNNQQRSTEVHFPAVLDGFHTYAIEWSPAAIRWTVDGQEYAVREASEWRTSGASVAGAPFDRPFYLIFNLAIGGGLPETRGVGGVSRDMFPRRFEIDWVRVWQRSPDLSNTGQSA